MAILKAAGMKKINFAGGEPFMNAEFLGQLVRYCKETLKLISVSLVTNGSKVTKKWLAKYGEYLDIMAISCDSLMKQQTLQSLEVPVITSRRLWT